MASFQFERFVYEHVSNCLARRPVGVPAVAAGRGDVSEVGSILEERP